MANTKDAIDALLVIEKELSEQLQTIQNTIKVLQDIGQLGSKLYTRMKSVSQSEQSLYNPKDSLKKKFAYFLKKKGRFLHMREVADLIAEEEGLSSTPKGLSSKISTSITSLKGKEIVKYQVGSKNTNCFWGLPEWLNERGQIKEGREINEEYLDSLDSSSRLFN